MSRSLGLYLRMTAVARAPCCALILGLTLLTESMGALAIEPEELEPVWAALQSRRTNTFVNGSPAEVPWSSLAEWRRLRREGPLGQLPLYLAEANADELATVLQTMHAEGYLGLERALLAAAVQGGVSDPAAAWVWDTALADFAAHAESDAASWLLRMRATQLGSTAALLPASCFPQTSEARRALESMMAAETAGRIWRPRSQVDTDVAFPDARARMVLPHIMEPTVWASLSSFRLAVPTTVAPDTLPVPETWSAADSACDPRAIAGILALDAAEPQAFAADFWALQTLAELGRVGPGTVVRFVVGRYLRGDVSALRALAAIESEAGRGELWPAQAIASLLASAELQSEQALALSAPFAEARDPFRLWVRAEALRAAERYTEARDTATQAIDRDPGFGAALITRAASWVGLGFPQEANSDLVFLETAWAPLPGYGAIIERLARVVR
jgi:tetratricopeptide (TPR) repeat protein